MTHLFISTLLGGLRTQTLSLSPSLGEQRWYVGSGANHPNLDPVQSNSFTISQAYYNEFDDPINMYRSTMQARTSSGRARRFDEYYRVYPTAMMSGPEREAVNHGGKMFLPASALDKLTQLHITYPMLFELINGAKQKMTHAGVLEFIAEEGRCYLPYWILVRLGLEPGDLLECKSTDLPPGNFIKLQPQNVSFLEISDPKAVLETAFRNFSCLTVGDVFTFSYNDEVYEIAVLEVKPAGEKQAVSVQETDLEVDFAAPVGYEEFAAKQKQASGTSTPGSVGSAMAGKGGAMYAQGTMAQAINYSAIAPSSSTVADGHAETISNFSGSGNRLVAKKGRPSVPTSTGGSGALKPTNGVSSTPLKTSKRRNGPQPLRLPPGKLFFGYEIKPQKAKQSNSEAEQPEKKHFAGEGQTLRKKK